MSESDTIRPGELFSQNYLNRGSLLQDQDLFRNRLSAYVQTNIKSDLLPLAEYLRRETGLEVVAHNFRQFFACAPIGVVLDSITLIWRFLRARHFLPKDGPLAALYREGLPEPWEQWASFVSRAMREQYMAYRLDERCGVHYAVDEEFERNIGSALVCLEAPRYAGARIAFAQAHSYLDVPPGDPKASVRSSFEAVEIVARLIDPGSQNLNKYLVANKLKPLAVALAADEIERKAVEKSFDGFAEFVDGLHNYRHGQGVEQAVTPSVTLAVYVLSSCASMLRWLVELDRSARPPK